MENLLQYINKTGYKDGYDTASNPFNIILGGDITMEGVSKDILAIPYKNGKPETPTLMKPNTNHKFNSDFVLEIPKAQFGFQFGVNPNIMDSIHEQYLTQQLGNPNQSLSNKGQMEMGNFNTNTNPNLVANLRQSPVEKQNTTNTTTNIPLDSNNTNFNTNQVGNNNNNFMNNLLNSPGLYGGVDLSSSLFKTGQSIGFDADDIENPIGRRKAKNANLMRGIGAAGKSILNIGRLVGAGLGQQNRLQQFYKNYNEQQRRALVNNFNFQEGGEFDLIDTPMLMESARDTVNDGINIPLDFDNQIIQEETLPKRELSTEEKVVSGLVSRGFSKEEASALAGNISVESRFEIGIEGDKHMKTPSYGLMQWRGSRKEQLFEKYGENPSLENQLDFISYELKGGNSYETKMFNKAKDKSKTVEDLAYNIAKYVERPSTSALNKSKEKRSGAARKYFNELDLVSYFKKGGTVEDFPTEKLLTGEYLTALPKSQEEEANVEIENKEYVIYPNGDVQEAVGDTHNQGGIKVKLDSGTKVISNSLKIGGDSAKLCNKRFDTKIKAKDTYAGAIKKYTNKIGLTKLNNEQEDLFKKLDKQKKVDDKTTQSLNAELLSSRIKEIEDKKKPLENLRREFSEYIFEKQEQNKND